MRRDPVIKEIEIESYLQDPDVIVTGDCYSAFTETHGFTSGPFEDFGAHVEDIRVTFRGIDITDVLTDEELGAFEEQLLEDLE